MMQPEKNVRITLNEPAWQRIIELLDELGTPPAKLAAATLEAHFRHGEVLDEQHWRVVVEVISADLAPRWWCYQACGPALTAEAAVDYALETIGEPPREFQLRCAWAVPEAAVSADVKLEPVTRAAFRRAEQ